MKRNVLIIMVLLGITLMTTMSRMVSEEVKAAICFCAEIMIPALFPIGFLSMIPVRLRLYNCLPEKLRFSFVFLLSLLAGYPIGAKLTDELCKNDGSHREQYQKVLPAMINAGPGYLVGFIGVGLFGNVTIGILMMTAQTITSLLFFAVGGGFHMVPPPGKTENISVFTVLDDTFHSVSTVCCFIILFGALKGVLRHFFCGRPLLIILALADITTATRQCKNLYGIAFMTGWCGLCIFAQVLTMTPSIHTNFWCLMVSRLLHAAIMTTIFALLIVLIKPSISTFSNLSENVTLRSSGGLSYCIVLSFALLALLFSMGRKKAGNLSDCVL